MRSKHWKMFMDMVVRTSHIKVTARRHPTSSPRVLHLNLRIGPHQRLYTLAAHTIASPMEAR